MSRYQAVLLSTTLWLPAAFAGSTAMAAEPSMLMSGTVVEIEAGRAVAEASCQRCHGLDGISRTAKLPHVAGQRAEYLYRKVRAYKAGKVLDAAMQGAVKYLTDDALRNAALYYASLPPRTVAPDAAAAKEIDPVAAGKAAAAPCAGCHGADGNSAIPGTPSLAGQTPRYLKASMRAYKSGSRSDAMMKSMLAAVGDGAVEDIALYYALQEPKPSTAPATGDVAAGRDAAAACAACHGKQGNSANPDVPSLAGQDAAYLAKATSAYARGTREYAVMKSTVAPLSTAEIANLAAFFASQVPQKATEVRKPLRAAEWAKKCDRCHGVDGNSMDPRYPALAGQRADYLVKALGEYQSRRDSSATMRAMVYALSKSEIRNIAAYYAQKQLKAVVFMPVDCK